MSDSDNYDDERNGLWFWIPLILILLVLFFIVRSCSNDSQLWQSSSNQSSTEISEVPGKTLDKTINSASNQLQNASNAVGNAAQSAKDSVKSAASNVGDATTNIGQSVKNSASDLTTSAARTAQSGVKTLQGSASDAANSLSNATRQSINGAENLAKSAVSRTGEAASGIASTVTESASSALKTGSSAATAAVDITRDTLSSSVEVLKSIPAGVIDSDVMEVLKSGKLRSGEQYPLATLQFNSAQTVISSADRSRLQAITQIVKAYPQSIIMVHGYSDSSGPEDFNQSLSTQRATVTKQLLTRLGVPDRQIEAQGHGSSQPVASNDTPQGRQKNRRTEITLRQ
ncbi:MAG: OmpA family protein [Gammaproteobacteria bacterium]|nr:OmpA family protein [Gammaproteobacteria bacterium]